MPKKNWRLRWVLWWPDKNSNRKFSVSEKDFNIDKRVR